MNLHSINPHTGAPPDIVRLAHLWQEDWGRHMAAAIRYTVSTGEIEYTTGETGYGWRQFPQVSVASWLLAPTPTTVLRQTSLIVVP